MHKQQQEARAQYNAQVVELRHSVKSKQAALNRLSAELLEAEKRAVAMRDAFNWAYGLYRKEVLLLEQLEQQGREFNE